MKTITLYITRTFLLTFVATLVVLVFVMSLGAIFKVTDYLARGAPWRPVLAIFLNGLPRALPEAVPISMLIAALLTFGRLSADGEITAMRACGLSSWQIMASPLAISIVMAIACIYVNNVAMPLGHYNQRLAIAQLGRESPLKLLEEGRFVQDFPGYTVYVGSKKGDRLKDIRIYETRKGGLNREVRAKTGIVYITTNDEDDVELSIDLFDVKIDPLTDDQPWPGFIGQYSVKIANLSQRRPYHKKETDLFFGELVDGIRNPVKFFPQMEGKDMSVPAMTMAVEMNKRLVLALSCVAFVLLGVPLGIRAHRKESSAGVAMSLLIMFGFYLFVIVAETLAKRPECRPDLIAWLPLLVCAELGYILLKRMN